MRRSRRRFLFGAIGAVAGLVLVIAASLVIGRAGRSDHREISYADLRTHVLRDQVAEIDWTLDGVITGRLSDGTEFETYGPSDGPTDADRELLRQHDVDVEFHTSQHDSAESVFPVLLPVALLLVAAGGVGGWWLMRRRGQRRRRVRA